jgi:hypothetical protein
MQLTYCANSGQMVSLGKSSIFFSPNITHTRAEICEALNINIEAISDKYLSLPWWERIEVIVLKMNNSAYKWMEREATVYWW